MPDAITFDISPQFSLSISYDAQDTDSEIDFIIADYSPPLAGLTDSTQFINIRFAAICQPDSAAGQASLIQFSDLPAVSFSRSDGQDASGSAISNSVLILSQADFTPQPTATATTIPTATATPVPVAGNHSPLVGNDSVVTNEDTAVLIDVLKNDSDPDGDSLTVDPLVLPQHGTVTRNFDNTITYVPTADYCGIDSFSYTASDGRGGALVANVNITIRAVNDPPIILIAPSNQVNLVGDAVALILSASDPDTAQDALIYSAQNLPFGIVIDSQRSLITGTLSLDAAGTYTVVASVSDGALSDSVQFQWTVTEQKVESDASDFIYLPIVSRTSSVNE